MSKVILASHGEMSKGLLNSVTMIVGDLAKEVQTYSLYPGESPNDMFEKIEAEVKANENEQFIILCDIKGGSVHTTLSKLIVYSNAVVLSGMNMNMVLDLLLSYGKGLSANDYDQLIVSAKEGITLLSNHLSESEDDDF
ncbi:MAG: hypothetical protein EOM50_06000 [Erysipelotrichia bacterium]|nr:hypothetical protein [Erysipelotrichia bacterium]NCC54139.1 hypothetical protein [Erysipelotrichia bacterium]